MLLIFGDSYSLDEGYEKHQQWFKELAKLLYGDTTKCKSYAAGGASNYNIIINQIFRNFYKHDNVEYIVINLTYLHRFRFYGNDYQPSMDANLSNVLYNRLITDKHEVSKDLVETYMHSFVLLNDITKHTEYGELIVTLNGFLRWADKQGIKILVFDVDGTHDNWWLDSKFYCKKKKIQNYISLKDNHNIYSNHLTLENNIELAAAIYDEIKK